jgi:hypothetical protein
MKPGPLCILACQWCNLPEFWEWVNFAMHPIVFNPIENSKDAAAFVKELCEVDSRKDLDTDVLAGRVFQDCIRKPFMAWQAKKVPA